MHNKNLIKIVSALVIIIICMATLIFYNLKNEDSTISDDVSGTHTSSTTNDKIILDYYIWEDEEPYISKVVDAYNALQASVQVNLHVGFSDSAKYDTYIDTILSSDTKIDLLGIRGISKMIQLKDDNYLLDLTSYIKNSDMDVTAYGNMFNEFAIDGNYYGMPTRSTCWVLYYNKDLFDEAGLNYPGQLTWDEYRELAISLTGGAGEDKIYGGYWVPWCFNFGALQHSSYLIDDDLSYTRKSLELLNTFYNFDGSHISYEQQEAQSIDIRSEFEKGTIALMPQGEWMVNMLLQDEEDGLTNINWDIAPMPVFEGQDDSITWGQYQFVSIISDTAYPQETFDFIQFLCGAEGARIYAEEGIIHAYSNDEIKQTYLKTVGKESASIFFETKKVQEQLAISNYEDILSAFSDCARAYLLGNKTIDETMSDFEKIRSELLTK